MRIAGAVLVLLWMTACSPEPHQPKTTVFDPMLQTEQQAKQVEQTLQANQQRQDQAIDAQTQ